MTVRSCEVSTASGVYWGWFTRSIHLLHKLYCSTDGDGVGGGIDGPSHVSICIMVTYYHINLNKLFELAHF